MIVLLMLPVLIFGGLTSSGTPSKPVLNDGEAVTAHMDSTSNACSESHICTSEF